MPIIKSAQKKLRQDKKRTKRNVTVRNHYKDLLKKAKKSKNKKDVRNAYAAIDKAAKRHVIHKNKAARLKSVIAHGTKS